MHNGSHEGLKNQFGKDPKCTGRDDTSEPLRPMPIDYGYHYAFLLHSTLLYSTLLYTISDRPGVLTGTAALVSHLANRAARHSSLEVRTTKTHFAGRFPWILLQKKI